MAQVATRQSGRVSAAQLAILGFGPEEIKRMCSRDQLTHVMPRVYAVGHTAPDRHGALWAAVLYAGEGAAISHATAAHLRGLLDYAPGVIEVSTRHDVKSIPGQVRVFARTDRERELVEGIPTCLIPDMVVDLAATGTPRMVRRALAQLDYKRQLTDTLIAAIEACCGRGRRGSRLTRQALARHKPQYGYANSEIEILFIDLCERWQVPLPICNHELHGIIVDAYWPQFALVVETDGAGNHSTPAQVDRDRTNDLTLRAHGITVLRYSKRQLEEDQGPVRLDLVSQMRAPGRARNRQVEDHDRQVEDQDRHVEDHRAA